MGTVKAPWKQLLLDALEANSHLKHSSFFHLATVGCNGRPSNRTVVFRGFQDDSDKIQINTDYRSRKIEELKHCPFAEICWYFTDSWEQFRINGKIDIIDGTNTDPLKLQVRETNTLLRLGCVLCFSFTSCYLKVCTFGMLGFVEATFKSK
ncbi:Pyridoxamine 5'-phosphate oxidase, Alr4036 family, FMN-binding domain containing protein [Trema orientale]|uniref:pyridoxal 5'-phosphate synthase n=1 Tax=Trema orientale TaxID=63057 RepID=A0A2P5FHL4_TREOI|nr:Pyridoxamine 5'-phosphate oxidase, Alr4036 family, FMN-binding domain containing protein [Trema orientale]